MVGVAHVARLAPLQPGGHLVHQRIAQAGMLDAFHRLADESLDQQRLGLLLRDAAGLEIEQQILVERARGRAVAALHVVGVDFELRLVVGLGIVGQQQRVGGHAGIGLLRLPAHDDLALEYAAPAVVEHRLEQLAAGAGGRRMLGEQRQVGVLRPLEQRRAANAGHRVGALEAHEQLVAHQRGAGGEEERIEARPRAHPRHHASRHARRRRPRRSA